MFQTPKRLHSTFPTKLAERFLSEAALLFGDFEGFCLKRYFVHCACQTSLLQIPKRLHRTFHTKLAERFSSKTALLFGDFEGFYLNFKAIFCTLYLSNFPSSNPFMPG